MNYLTLDAHEDESIHSGTTFSTPAFSTPAFSTPVFSTPEFSSPAFSVAPSEPMCNNSVIAERF